MGWLKRTAEADLPRMQCMEIWGGNRATVNSFRAPGLDIHVNCLPYGDSQSGGDIYYLTSCASGRISRLLLVDVAGHGQIAADLADNLRDQLRSNVNRVSQQRFVEAMNQEFTENVTDGFATAVVATYFAPRNRLSLSVAGHPNPIFFSARQDRWYTIDQVRKTGGSPSNLPLGVIEAANYPGCELTTSAGDMFLLYSDAFNESVDRAGKQIGIDGITERLNQNRTHPQEVIPALIASIKSEFAENLDHDDATAILGSITKIKPGWKNNLLAPWRFLQGAKDRSVLEHE